jgi:pyruvate dehydrogenase E2 component (dihydrolipoamide acetyltransferase)
MAVDVILPKVDMDMDTGSISKWHVKDGDTVSKGQAIFDIETDKSAMEIESPGEGVIKISDVKVGEAIAIGTVVAMVFGVGEIPKDFAGAAPSTLAGSVVPAETQLPTQVSAAPVDVRQREDDGAGARDGNVRATPLARRLARQNRVSLTDVSGSGPRGRIVAGDVLKAKTSPVVQVSGVRRADRASDGDDIRKLYADGSYTVLPLDGMRRTIAQRLSHSKQTVPHFYLTATCTVDHLLATRERLNAAARDGAYKFSINDFIIKAYALALQKVPAANATYTENGILLHASSDVGVAVSVEGGLFTPVIRGAEAKSLSVISAEMKDLATRARSRKLQAHEYQGGSAAISNLGMFGVEQFTAIINPPHASILAVGSTVERFVPVNKQPVFATQMTVTLSVDHRAVDGAVAAQLLAAFKALLEEPALMLV